MGTREFGRGRRFVARLTYGADLLEEIAAIARHHDLVVAELRGIGALQRARLAFYDQSGHTYEELAVDEALEIASLLGTISRRDGDIAVHAHATLAREDGACVGGHVAPGCVVFAGEVVLQELLGEALERELDEQTGLTLWRGL